MTRAAALLWITVATILALVGVGMHLRIKDLEAQLRDSETRACVPLVKGASR